MRGIEAHESTRLAETEIVAFVRDAFAIVIRAPRVPDGAPYGASVKDKGAGFALRLIRAYDPNIAADTSLLTAFVGVQPMPLAGAAMAAFTDRDELLRRIVESVLTKSPLTLDTLTDAQRVHLDQEARTGGSRHLRSFYSHAPRSSLSSRRNARPRPSHSR